MKSKPAFIKAFAAGSVFLGAISALFFHYYHKTYLCFSTKFGQARIFQVKDDQGNSVRLLEVDRIVQSGTYLDEHYTDLVFEYLKRYDLMFQADRPIARICVLGCGGYDYPKHLIAHHPEVFIDAIEIDPFITALAHRYFYLDRLFEEYEIESTQRLTLIEADALEYLKAFSQPSGKIKTNEPYDVIVNDTFDGGKPPSHLTTLQFLQTVHSSLVQGGLFLTNIVAPLQGKGADFLAEQVALMETVFRFVYIFPCTEDSLTEPDNVIVAATDISLPKDLSKLSL